MSTKLRVDCQFNDLHAWVGFRDIRHDALLTSAPALSDYCRQSAGSCFMKPCAGLALVTARGTQAPPVGLQAHLVIHFNHCFKQLFPQYRILEIAFSAKSSMNEATIDMPTGLASATRI